MTVQAPIALPNNVRFAGSSASRPVMYGPEFGGAPRYETIAVHTRFDQVQWFTYDRATPDHINPAWPAVIRQEDTFEAALVE